MKQTRSRSTGLADVKNSSPPGGLTLIKMFAFVCGIFCNSEIIKVTSNLTLEDLNILFLSQNKKKDLTFLRNDELYETIIYYF